MIVLTLKMCTGDEGSEQSLVLFLFVFGIREDLGLMRGSRNFCQRGSNNDSVFLVEMSRS